METLLSPVNAMATAARIIPSSERILKQNEERMTGGTKVEEEEGREVDMQREITRLLADQAEVKRFLDANGVSGCDASNLRRRTETEEGAIRAQVDSSPKKRVVMFSAFLACLSCVIILCNLVISFANDILRDDAFLDIFKKYIKDAKNHSEQSTPVVTEP